MDSPRKVALVTGGARRIGAAIVQALHAAGYDIALHCRESRDEADALARRLEQARPGSARVLQAELADYDRLPELVAHTVGGFGRLDALVNNASSFFPTPLGTIRPAQWDALFASNARAPLFLAQAAAPHLAHAGGAIVNLVDIHAEQPLAGHAVYAMAKAALVAMTRALAIDLAPRVRVNAIAPGAILWPEHDEDPARREELLARTPLARTGTAEEVAEAVRWLLQDAGFVTGQVMRLDGGRGLAV